MKPQWDPEVYCLIDNTRLFYKAKSTLPTIRYSRLDLLNIKARMDPIAIDPGKT